MREVIDIALSVLALLGILAAALLALALIILFTRSIGGALRGEYDNTKAKNIISSKKAGRR